MSESGSRCVDRTQLQPCTRVCRFPTALLQLHGRGAPGVTKCRWLRPPAAPAHPGCSTGPVQEHGLARGEDCAVAGWWWLISTPDALIWRSAGAFVVQGRPQRRRVPAAQDSGAQPNADWCLDSAQWLMTPAQPWNSSQAHRHSTVSKYTVMATCSHPVWRWVCLVLWLQGGLVRYSQAWSLMNVHVRLAVHPCTIENGRSNPEAPDAFMCFQSADVREVYACANI